jgi:hypothetical protein
MVQKLSALGADMKAIFVPEEHSIEERDIG